MGDKIIVKPDGPGGWAYYVENGNTLPFFWEPTSVGLAINVPASSGWSNFCEKNSADWAKGRREEILQKVAEVVRRKRYLKGDINIEDSWIYISSS